MLIIYNPGKNLFVLTILRLAMLINIGVFGVWARRGGFCDCGIICTTKLHARKIKNDGGDFEIARRTKRYYQNMDNSLKPKRSKKEKKGYIYIYSIYYFFFFF